MLTCRVISICDVCGKNSFLDLSMPNSQFPAGKFCSSFKNINLSDKHYLVCDKCFLEIQFFIKNLKTKA